MNLLLAGVIAIIVALVHTVLGEILIFRHLRENQLVPTIAPAPLRQRHIQIVWASWHIVTLFGIALGAMLVALYYSADGTISKSIVLPVIMLAMFFAAVLVLFATKAKHPGWIGLLAVALLSWFSV